MCHRCASLNVPNSIIKDKTKIKIAYTHVVVQVFMRQVIALKDKKKLKCGRLSTITFVPGDVYAIGEKIISI